MDTHVSLPCMLVLISAVPLVIARMQGGLSAPSREVLVLHACTGNEPWHEGYARR